MKRLLLAAFLFAFIVKSEAQTAKVDTIVTEKWTGTAWQDSGRTVSTYDANCHLTTLLQQLWNTGSSAWVNSFQINFTYASGDYVSEAITQQWNKNNSTWKNVSRSTYTYDGSFKILTITIDLWLSNTWQTSAISTYSYNTNGYVDSILTQSALIILQNTSLVTYTYNSDNTPSVVLNQTWDGVSAWVNASRTTYTYNGDKTVHQTVIETWSGSAWENEERITYTYNGSAKVLTETTENWDTGTSTWVNSELTTNTYNGNGDLATALHQSWNTGTSAWDNETRDTYTYSTSCTLPLTLLNFTASRNNNVISLTWQTSNEVNTSHFNIQRSADGVNFTTAGNVTAKGNSALTNNYSFTDDAKKINGDKVYYRLQMVDKDGKYTFSKIVPITLLVYTGNIKTYPNPVKDQLYILFNAQNAGKATLRISDASGKIVHAETISTSVTALGVNVSRLGKGVYYVQLITDKGTQRTQFVKQ
ncbi:T9SS type A sorting domain-containing protein [Panacibacter ginsenosidivorans]|uniref:T9SS type A sorting domain-containing protein n=1 Tax=Panacibacter ginsenosidivorans TaxID=1813871 RepID=A0A5B8VCP3_9BACT|nr:T9SS type A sorting domain-containing protein [Panacibacter ginsenosidivorans]QEC68773.1 T9SS type A sorting domain-containing protein [Panacibacter ginsenosidivorans]